MTLRKRWSVTCDAPGCDRTRLLEGDQYDGRWSLGTLITDEGWAAAPGAAQTFCPNHTHLFPKETSDD